MMISGPNAPRNRLEHIQLLTNPGAFQATAAAAPPTQQTHAPAVVVETFPASAPAPSATATMQPPEVALRTVPNRLVDTPSILNPGVATPPSASPDRLAASQARINGILDTMASQRREAAALQAQQAPPPVADVQMAAVTTPHQAAEQLITPQATPAGSGLARRAFDVANRINSTGRCYNVVAFQVLDKILPSNVSQRFRGSQARNALPTLNALTNEGLLQNVTDQVLRGNPQNIRTADNIPPGSIVLYTDGAHGHIEVYTGRDPQNPALNAFGSDHISNGYPGRVIAGIWAPTQAMPTIA